MPVVAWCGRRVIIIYNKLLNTIHDKYHHHSSKLEAQARPVRFETRSIEIHK